MANTYHQVYIQAVFAPKYRASVLIEEIQPIVFGMLGNLINESGCKTLIVNGMEDHVHCFFGLLPRISISNLMQSVKGVSSKTINDNHITKSYFEWQIGYGAFSYSHWDKSKIFNYVKNQKVHHANQSFRQEYIELLNTFDIDYTEEYLFHDPI